MIFWPGLAIAPAMGRHVLARCGSRRKVALEPAMSPRRPGGRLLLGCLPWRGVQGLAEVPV